MGKRLRHLGPRLALAILVAFLTGEVVVRIAVAANPRIRYIVADQELGEFPTLEQLLETQPFLIPHTGRFGYWTNSFGFNDQEFEEPGSLGRTRILALGDSFSYGAVPYPFVVLTKVEEKLGPQVELLNCGLPGQDLSGYRALLQTTVERFAPDLVALHIYLGNDGPDFLESPVSRPLYSYLIRFTSRIRRLLEEKAQPVHPEASPLPGQTVSGGTKVHPGAPDLSDDDLNKARVSDDEFERQLRAELGRFHMTQQEGEHWAPLEKELHTIRQILESRGIPLVVVLYPSRLQIYPEQTLQLVRSAAREPSALDLELPNRFFANYCREHSIPLLDLTEVLRKEAERGAPLYVANDTHWNIRGNAVAAEAEAEFLEDFVSAGR